MVVCVCRSVTDKDIRKVVEAGHCDPTALRDRLGVGTGCGRCRDYAAALVRHWTGDRNDRTHAA